MNKILTTCVFATALLSAAMKAQAPAWGWAKSTGGSGNDGTNGIYVDASKNTYATGSFASPSITFGTTTLTNNGGLDYFVVKYDPSGNVLWAKGANGLSNDVGNSVAVDAAGNVYVLATSNSTVITFGTVHFTLHGHDDIIVIKYNSSGTVIWAKGFGGNLDDVSEGIAVDANGNSYITGYFGSVGFSFGTKPVSNAGTNNAFITKLDSSGTVLWANSAGGTNDDRANGIALDASGNTWITGYFSSASASFGTVSLTNTGSDDCFLAKYDASGAISWAKGTVGASNEIGYSVTADASGNAYVAGAFNGSSMTAGTTTLNNQGNDDAFALKYNASGTLQWAKAAGGTLNDIGDAIAVDASGDVYVAGYFASPSLVFGTTTLNNIGTNNMFITKYDGSGNVLWAEKAGGSSDDRINCMHLDADGNAYVGGFFSTPTINLGTNVFTNAGNSGTQDMYVAKLVSGNTGILENTMPSTVLKAFPNPTTGLFELAFTHSINPVATVILMDMQGREVYREKRDFNQAGSRLDLSSRPDGLYYVVVDDGTVLYCSKVMLTR
ncbi:MAG TPA: SBBP repeat-containing protein [Bacteroidia bacterium]|jgi:hypothetical protein|nr:SBBP repeat-containing protein [Bacteroidia bacterium]